MFSKSQGWKTLNPYVLYEYDLVIVAAMRLKRHLLLSRFYLQDVSTLVSGAIAVVQSDAIIFALILSSSMFCLHTLQA